VAADAHTLDKSLRMANAEKRKIQIKKKGRSEQRQKPLSVRTAGRRARPQYSPAAG